MDFFSEVFAVAPNLFLPIKTKTLIQLNPVFLTLVICHSPLFRTNIHFTWFFPFFFSRFTSHNSHSVIPNSPLIRSYFCRRIRERQMRKKSAHTRGIFAGKDRRNQNPFAGPIYLFFANGPMNSDLFEFLGPFVGNVHLKYSCSLCVKCTWKCSLQLFPANSLLVCADLKP